MDIETRVTFIDLIGNIEMLVDAMVEQEVMKPTEELQRIRKDYRALKMALCEPFRNASKTKNEKPENDCD